MQKGKGKEKFIGMLHDMMQQKQERGLTTSIELGTYHNAGILPDSYPDGEDPDDDYYLLEISPLAEGDKVLIVWTDDGDLVAIGKLEGGDSDDG